MLTLCDAQMYGRFQRKPPDYNYFFENAPLQVESPSGNLAKYYSIPADLDRNPKTLYFLYMP